MTHVLHVALVPQVLLAQLPDLRQVDVGACTASRAGRDVGLLAVAVDAATREGKTSRWSILTRWRRRLRPSVQPWKSGSARAAGVRCSAGTTPSRPSAGHAAQTACYRMPLTSPALCWRRLGEVAAQRRTWRPAAWLPMPVAIGVPGGLRAVLRLPPRQGKEYVRKDQGQCGANGGPCAKRGNAGSRDRLADNLAAGRGKVARGDPSKIEVVPKGRRKNRCPGPCFGSFAFPA